MHISNNPHYKFRVCITSTTSTDIFKYIFVSQNWSLGSFRVLAWSHLTSLSALNHQSMWWCPKSLETTLIRSTFFGRMDSVNGFLCFFFNSSTIKSKARISNGMRIEVSAFKCFRSHLRWVVYMYICIIASLHSQHLVCIPHHICVDGCDDDDKTFYDGIDDTKRRVKTVTIWYVCCECKVKISDTHSFIVRVLDHFFVDWKLSSLWS